MSRRKRQTKRMSETQRVGWILGAGLPCVVLLQATVMEVHNV